MDEGMQFVLIILFAFVCFCIADSDGCNMDVT